MLPAIFLSPLPAMSCGILEFLFTDIPQRYIEREVGNVEVVGTWRLTSESDTQINSYLEQADSPVGIAAPWKAISIYSDGTCQVEMETSWVSASGGVLKEANTLATCTWQIKNVLGYREDGTFSDVPGVALRFEHFNDQTDAYEVYYSELYIVEEDGELILWSYVGDAYASRYQDFKRTQE